MAPLKIICILIILVGLGQGEDIIFFADDHYKSSSEIVFSASATNPALLPGQSILEVSLANLGRINEIIPISSNGSPDDILLEIEEEMNSSMALEIRASLEPIGPIKVTSGPQYISVLPAGEARSLEFNLSIDRKASGWYNLPLQVNYVRQADVSVSDGEAFPLRQPTNQSLNLRVYISGYKDLLRIAGVQSNLYPGGKGTLIVAVENFGEDTISNCSASLMAAPPFHVLSPDHPLGELPAGEMAAVSFLVGVDGNASQKEYQLGLRLRSEGRDLVVPFELSLKGSESLLSHPTFPLIVLLAFLALLTLAVIIMRRQKLLYGRIKRTKRW